MTTAPTAPTIDPAALEAFAGFVGGQAAAAANAFLVGLGDELGIWKAMAFAGPLTSADVAGRTGLAERHVREWLAAQAGNGFLVFDPEAETFLLTDEAAMVLAVEDSPALMVAVFRGCGALARMMPALADAFRSGDGLHWHDREPDFFDTQERFSRPLQSQFLVDAWLASVPGLVERLEAGARVADVGCGYGHSTILLAQRFPASTFVGFDFHDHSVARARQAARQAGVSDRASFEVADGATFPGEGYDVVLFVDSLHDMGNPVDAARHARETLAADGILVTLDPVAGDSLAENLADPMAGMMYAVSTFLCTPTALAQHGTHALGAMGGEAALLDVLRQAGFAAPERVGRDAPVNMVLVGRR